ncbi:SPJ_0845 family protein [Periweissella cryptocerci]|nr:SPJ_0845 family protein [Periweissella cryptocerci]
MALTLKRETNFDKMLGDMISLPLDDEDNKAKDRALGRTKENTSDKKD